MVNNKKTSGNKLPYEKPKLRTINLLADEVLGVKCKQAGSPVGRNGVGCGASHCSVTTGS
jgi:hypothetical protein